MRAGEAWTYISERIRIEDRGHSSPCWVWQLSTTEKGYGRGFIPGFGKNTRIHRASYELHVGPIPEGLVIDHLCCVKACCNPAHLEAVTDEENRRRAKVLRQPPTHCRHGHELSGSNLRIEPRGSRVCRACHRARVREWAKRNPEKVWRGKPKPISPAKREQYNAKRREMRAAGLWSR
jgi:hypothetical protein